MFLYNSITITDDKRPEEIRLGIHENLNIRFKKCKGEMTTNAQNVNPDKEEHFHNARAQWTAVPNLQAFAGKWHLDVAAQQYLHTLPPDVRMAVLRQFKPSPGTVNASAKLHSFANGIWRSSTAAARGYWR